MSIKFEDKQYTLRDEAFIAQGGQAKIYGFDDIVIKIYHERKHVLSEKKFSELKVFRSEPGIISPIDFAYEHNSRVGYGMPWIKHVIPWAQMLSNGFWSDNGITTSIVNITVDYLRRLFVTVHSFSDITAIGDPNEFNFLVTEKSYTPVYAIDVDAWGTSSSPVSAVAPGVKDLHSKEFNHGTDWFGFAIITFMLYTGVSPYRGRHPDFDRDIVGRMKANVSAYDSKVKLPPNTRPMGEIPSGLSGWYEAVLQNGERNAPPEHFGTAKGTIAVQTTISKKLIITVEKTFPKDIRKIWGKGGLVVLKDELDYIELNGKKYIITLEDDKLTICNLQVAASKYTVVDNIIYTFFEGKVNKIDIIALNGNSVAAIGNSWKVLPNSTVLFEGLLLSNILGVPYLYLPDKDSLHRFKVDELLGYKIANARRIGPIAIVIGYKKGEGYKRFIFNIKDFVSYTVYKHDTSTTDINFCMLSTGVYLILNDQDILEIRHVRKGDTCTEVKNTGLPNGVRLASTDQKALIYVNNEIKRIRLNI